MTSSTEGLRKRLDYARLFSSDRSGLGESGELFDAVGDRVVEDAKALVGVCVARG